MHSHGYLAIAPAAFSRIKKAVDLGYTPDDMKAGFELKTAVEQLAK
jgi:carboxymethylenebutenolidase